MKSILTAICLAALASLAAAQNNPPGSLLLFPEFDNRAGEVNLVTVTNTSTSSVGGTIDVEFVYIGRRVNNDIEISCSEFNRTERLTPGDTLSLLTRYHNPELEQGYLYVFAKDPETGEPVVFNHLVGSGLHISTISVLDFSTNSATFRGVGSSDGAEAADFTPTDIDGDGIRDLNGLEYQQVADEIIIPRFFGQNFFVQSELYLVSLAPSGFETTLDFLIYNDNEEVFSAEHSFTCWDKVPLLEISGVFDNLFLRLYTDNDPDEVIGFRGVETGWIHIDGGLASSTAQSISDPAFFAFLAEGLITLRVADLPFTIGLQANGDLLNRTLFTDGD